MADYYPLIARAIAGLDPSAPGEARRALYERARSALIAQLRGVQPPLSESEITRERLALEEAVRKVESEAAQRAREATRDKERNRTSGDAMRAGGRPAPRPDARPGTPGPATAGRRAAAPPPTARSVGAEAGRAGAAARRGSPPPRPSRPEPPRAEPPNRERPRRAAAPPPPKSDAAMRGFRDVVADVDDLGRAAAQANRAARKTYANVTSPSPEFDRLEPSLENRTEADAALFLRRIAGGGRALPAAGAAAAGEDAEDQAGRRRFSDQERDRARRGADAGRRRLPVGAGAVLSACARC